MGEKKSLKLSVDLGYSGVKWYYINEEGQERMGKFPSVAKEYTDFANNGLALGASNLYEFNNRFYYIGDEAVEYDTELNRKSSLLVEFAPLFIYKVIKDNKLDGYDIQLVTGLSLKDWNDKTLKELNNVITTAVVNGEKVLNQNIKILPQGRGLAYDYFRNKKEEGNILVFDIGYNTFDLIHINKGVTSPRTSFANEMGVHCVVDRIRQHLLNNKIDWSSSEINDLLVENKLIFKVNGKPIDITEVYKESVVDYIKQLNLKCVSEIKPLMERADILLFGGGGAYILKQLKKKEIADIFQREEIDFVSEPYEFSNARGYYFREMREEQE